MKICRRMAFPAFFILSLFLTTQARAETSADVEQFLAQLAAKTECGEIGGLDAVIEPIPAGCSCSVGQDSQGNTCSCNASGAGASCVSSGQGTKKKCTCTDADGTIVCQIVDGHCNCAAP